MNKAFVIASFAQYQAIINRNVPDVNFFDKNGLIFTKTNHKNVIGQINTR